jgi:manganese efflux pump family protein
MDVFTTLLIAFGVAMDAFAVSIAKGITVNNNRRKSAILLASFFGGFQMLMPVLGWFAGLSFREVISGIDHWIAFGLLFVIGGKMIFDSRKNEDCQREVKLFSVLTLAVATSIDALMVGVSFAFLDISIAFPIVIIGIVTFLLSFVGFIFGCGIGKGFGKKIKILGGIMLVAIGIRILLENLL